MPLRRLLALLFIAALFVPTAASAQEIDRPPPVDVIDVSGPLDQRAIDLMIRSIEDTEAQAVILQIDSPGALTSGIEELRDLIVDPPVPVIVWVGPRPARAYGGAAQLMAFAEVKAAAPGVKVGYMFLTVAGDRLPDDTSSSVEQRENIALLAEILFSKVVIEESGSPHVDMVVPSIGQLVVNLHGLEFEIGGETVVLDTAETVVGEDGVSRLSPTAQVRFDKGAILDRTLRLAVRPEATFFFFVAGLSLAVFEFYAAGVGVMAAVAALSLFLSGYGLSVLPIRWWAVGATLLGLLAYIADFQRNDLGWRSILGTLLLLMGGLYLTDASPLFAPIWWAIVLVVIGTALFFGIGMTAVVRSRFSTTTIGREHLIGRAGIAESDLDPTGVVSVDGARWRAKATRAAGIRLGDPVDVVAVDGIVLDVDPFSARESVSE